MKRQLFFVLFLFGCSTAWSQTKTTTEISTTSNDRYKVETNRFFDNWFIGAGSGGKIMFSDHDKQMPFKDRLSPTYEVYIGKWFTPGLGLRFAGNGFGAKGLTQNGAYSTGEVFDASRNLYVQLVDYYQLRGDIMLNLMNVLGGYNPKRFYSLSPFFGVGLAVSTVGTRDKELTANIGFLNAFRLSSAFDFIADFRGSLVNDRFDGEVAKRRQDGLLTATFGFRYNFKQRTWDRSTTKTIQVYDEEELNKLRTRVNELANDNEALRNRLANAKNQNITDIEVEKKIIAAPILLTFPINKSDISNEMRVNLKYFAQVIKEGSSNVRYKITGYADKGTGTAETNDRLSVARAKAVYDVLVKEFNVSPSQLNMESKGGVDNMFYDDPRLSRAVITIGY